MREHNRDCWALILGGSSGFGLATAKKLAAEGMSVCVVHRDRRGSMDRIEKDFEEIRSRGRGFLALNLDALSPEGVATTLRELREAMGVQGRVRLLLHSIAFGNLKPIAPARAGHGARPAADAALCRLATSLGVERARLDEAVGKAFDEGADALSALIPTPAGEFQMEDEDVARTIYAMGTSLLTWTQRLFTEGFFASDARVIGLTSEGNSIAWRGYAAVAAAKCALESVSRAIAVEYGPHGLCSNIIQAGVTDTPALRLIPGSAQMKASAALRNPLGRTTTPEDVANVVWLLSLDEARWINGALIRVDGGEHIAAP